MNYQECSLEQLEKANNNDDKAICTLLSYLTKAGNDSVKKIVYVDMDGVLVDLHKAIKEYPEEMVKEAGNDIDKLPNLFLDPPPMQGAIEAFNVLCSLFDVYILSTAPWNNPEALMHKRLWVEKYLGKNAYKRLILSHNKHLNIGDFLIDDRTANGAGEFTGEHIHFGTDKFPSWASVLDYLIPLS
tara:strand:+ start:853 stop:1410 length:558 start_codon:yes stop_codon:yes gene_type:complete